MKFVGRGHLYRLVFGGHASFEKSSGSGGLFRAHVGRRLSTQPKSGYEIFPPSAAELLHS